MKTSNTTILQPGHSSTRELETRYCCFLPFLDINYLLQLFSCFWCFNLTLLLLKFQQLIRHGPEQDMRDPVTVFNSISGTKDRRFSLKWYTRILPDGSKEERRWMLYSRSRNVVFCFCCILFSTTKKSSFADINKGFYRWQKLCPAVPEHEQSPGIKASSI